MGVGEFDCCTARVVPCGKRRSGVTTVKATRFAGAVLSQLSYPTAGLAAPDVSAIPSQNCDIWCQLADPVAKCWITQEMSQPPAGGGTMVIWKSVVIPAFASPMITAQFAVARSAAVRATLARNRALYERHSWMNCAEVSALPLIHVLGSGNPLASAVTTAIAESRYPSAAVITA